MFDGIGDVSDDIRTVVLWRRKLQRMFGSNMAITVVSGADQLLSGMWSCMFSQYMNSILSGDLSIRDLNFLLLEVQKIHEWE